MLQAGLVIVICSMMPFLSAAPAPQSQEWTLGAGVLFGAIAAGMFVKGETWVGTFTNALNSGMFIQTGDYAADIALPTLTFGREKPLLGGSYSVLL